MSVVWFRHEGLRGHVPLSHGLRAGEANLRTYVRHRRTGEEGVWFLDVVLSPPAGSLFGAATVMRARSERCCVRSCVDGGRRFYAWSGGRGNARGGVVQDLDVPGPVPPGFKSHRDAREFLVERHVGFYDRTLPFFNTGRMEVQHRPLRLTAGRLLEARLPIARCLGLLDASQVLSPHSVYVSPGARFTAHVTYGHPD